MIAKNERLSGIISKKRKLGQHCKREICSFVFSNGFEASDHQSFVMFLAHPKKNVMLISTFIAMAVMSITFVQ